jgi:tRNA-dihydrouridine synthase C
VRDPGLGLAIKADSLGQQAPVSWPALLPLIADFWHIVCSRIEPRARAGRLKQWLNFLRRRFPEAETAYQAIKTVNDPVLVEAWLVQVLRSEGLEQPAMYQPLLEAA